MTEGAGMTARLFCRVLAVPDAGYFAASFRRAVLVTTASTGTSL